MHLLKMRIVSLGFAMMMALAAVSPATAIDSGDLTLLSGTYYGVSQGGFFWDYGDGVQDGIFTEYLTLNFDGAGKCSVIFDEVTYEVPLSREPDNEEVIEKFTDSGSVSDLVCTYDVFSDNSAIIDFGGGDTESLRVRVDGDVFMAGGADRETEPGGTGSEVARMVAIKAGSGMTEASLVGKFKGVVLGSSFFQYPFYFDEIQDQYYFATDAVFAEKLVLNFDGQGNCSLSGNENYYWTQTILPDSVSKENDIFIDTCTYSVEPDGSATIYFSQVDTVDFKVSANGNVLLLGGDEYEYYPTRDETEVESYMLVAMKVAEELNETNLLGYYEGMGNGTGFFRYQVWNQDISDYEGRVAEFLFSDNVELNSDGRGRCQVAISGTEYSTQMYYPDNVSVETDYVFLPCVYYVNPNGTTKVDTCDEGEIVTEVVQLGDGGNLIMDGGGGSIIEEGGKVYATGQTTLIKTQPEDVDTDGDGVLDFLDDYPLDDSITQDLDLNKCEVKQFESGETVFVSWPAVENATCYSVKYSLDNGGSWEYANNQFSVYSTTTNDTKLKWHVPVVSSIKKKSGRVTVSAYDNCVKYVPIKVGSVKSIVPFNVVPARPLELLTVFDESYVSGEEVIIDWSAPRAAATIKAKATTDGGRTWQVIGEAPATDEQMTVTLPYVIKDKPESQVKLFAYSSDGDKLSAVKSDLFEITETLDFTSPAGGEVWTGGTEQTVSWTVGNLPAPIEKLIVKYTTNGGTTWKELVTKYTEAHASVTEVLWTIPAVSKDKPKTKIKVIIKDGDDNVMGKTTSGYLTIIPMPE